MLPSGWPVYDPTSGLRYDEALLIVPKNFSHANRGTCRCMFETVTTDSFNRQLGGASLAGYPSVFDRLGFTEPDGSPIKITSHQFRHYLNTLAQRKNLDQLSIALWSSRKDVRQNRAYDHVSAEESLELMRQAEPSKVLGPLAEVLANPPISREAFLALKFPTSHTTEFGFCVHDWTMLPCQRHRACIDCTEHVCINGDWKKTERVRNALIDAETQLERDEVAVGEGILGADRWVEYNRARVERLRGLIAILDDPNVRPGTIIQLAGTNEYSPVGIAVDDRMQLDDADSQELRRIRAQALEREAKYFPAELRTGEEK